MTAPLSVFPRFLTVGFVGARRIDDREEPLRQRIDQVLARLEGQLRTNESLSAVSAVAAGADTVFAEAAAARQLLHQVFLPVAPDTFFDEKDFFDSPTILARSKAILDGENVIEVRIVSDSPDRRTRFSDCGYQIVHECDVLIAVLPDDTGGKPGGTRETFEHARAVGLRIFKITLNDALTLEEIPPETDSATDPDASWSLPIEIRPDATADSHATISALKAAASSRAKRFKGAFHYVTGLVLVTHLGATAIAVYCLAHAGHDPMIKWVKAGLLLAGMGIYASLHRRRPQRDWVTARLVAELCRSVLAVRGLPGYLAYLSDFHIPGCRELVRSLNILHLKAIRHEATAPDAFADRYARERIGTVGQIARSAQLFHYGERSKTARKWRTWLEIAFYAFSILALSGAAGYAHSHFDEARATWFQREAFWVAPILFPVIAAAAASLISILDLDRRVETYGMMIHFLNQQRRNVEQAKSSQALLVRAVHSTERALLQEVVEWHAKHVYLRGG